jgi:hypothetical protein
MTRRIPQVTDGVLHVLDPSGGPEIAVASPSWIAWLSSLRRGDPVRRAQDTQGVFAQTSATGKSAWRLDPSRSSASSMPTPSMSHRKGGGGSPDEAPAPKKSTRRRALRAPDGGKL